MRSAVHEVGRRFVRERTTVVDLGCSRGEALAPFVDEFEGRCGFVACEVSEPMRAAAEERFAGRTGVYVRDTDLRRGYPVPVAKPNVSLTLAVLTLQFV